MNHASPTLPKAACSYERYDPATLKPINDDTYIRLIETGWAEETFRGKSVLDIGSNSGALSLFAHQLGAASVHAFEIQAPFVEFFSEVVRQHDLPIKVEQGGFNKLNVEDHTADVVLCMEVLHWIVHQGGLLPEAIARLASITTETLYIETPWDVKEPSIATRPTYPLENYDIEIILRELAKHFEEVRVERFMTYFGVMANSKRVLIKATGKRTATLPLRHIRDTNPTGFSLSRGVNPSTLLTTTQGPKILKTLPGNSIFVHLDDDQVEALGSFLNGTDVISPIVAPERIGASFRQREDDGKTYMLFPFVGDLGDYFPKRVMPRQVDEPMDLAVAVFLHLSHAPADLVSSMRSLCGPLKPFDYRTLPQSYVDLLEGAGLEQFLDQAAGALKGYDPALEDALLHNDMQLGNMVRTPDGWDRMVDLDLIRPGPVYADMFSCAMHTGASAETLRTALDEVAEMAPRVPTGFDLDFAVTGGVRWFESYQKMQKEVPQRVLDRFVAALNMLRDIRSELD